MNKQNEVINKILSEDNNDLDSLKKDDKLLNKDIDNMGLFLQFILVVLIGIMGVVTLFINELLPVIEILLGLTILIMAYNNFKVYKHKGLTIIYTVIALILLIGSIYSYLGEI